MTTYVHHVPQPTQAFIFSATLDQQPVTCRVPWSLFGNRWYLQMLDSSNLLIAYRALIGSPMPVPIKNITWELHDGVFVETVVPHMFEEMATCHLTLRGVVPNVLNGLWSCYITGPTTFTFKYPEHISAIESYGQVSYDINLAAGYFAVSTLVYRQSTQLFEINP